LEAAETDFKTKKMEWKVSKCNIHLNTVSFYFVCFKK
jgi:hypothetical protein